MMQEDHVKPRTTDYAGYAIMDGNVITTEAHVLLKEKNSADMLSLGDSEVAVGAAADAKVAKAAAAKTTATKAE